MGTPTTIQQIVVLIGVVLPGVVYQFLREHWHGRAVRDQNLSERVLRAVVAGLVLNGLYLLAAGPWLDGLIGRGKLSPSAAFAARPREIALVSLLLFVLIPAAAAAAMTYGERFLRPSAPQAAYRPAISAWKYAFEDRGACFVRIRLQDGAWVGGWYGTRSLASTFPHEGELFLESQYEMQPDGSFSGRIHQTGGVLVRPDRIDGQGACR